MSVTTPIKPDADLKQRRTEIFRSLKVLNSLNLGVILLVATLGIIAIFLGLKAQEDAENLWAASVTQARASRFGGEIGWKSNALTTIHRASEVRPSLALRNEAIAAFSTLDLEMVGRWHNKRAQYGKLVFTPDLRYAALGNPDGTVEFLDGVTGKGLRTFKMRDPVAAVIFDGTGRYLAARDNRGRLLVWTVETGSEVISATLDADPNTYDTVAFAGNRVVASLPRGRLFYGSMAGENQRIVDIGQDYQLLASDWTGGVLIGSKEKLLEIRDAETGALLKSFTSPGQISSVAVSAGGKYAAAGSSDTSIYLWNVADGDMQILRGHQGLVFRVFFDPAGDRVASCAFGGTARIWEVASGFQVLSTESLFLERFGSDGISLACSRTETGFGLARLASSDVVRGLSFENAGENIFVTPFISEDWIVVESARGVLIADATSGAIVAKSPAQGPRAAVFDDKNMALYTTGRENLQRWPLIRTTNGLAFGSPRNIPLDGRKAYEGLILNKDRTEALIRIGFEGALLLDLATEKVLAFFPTPNIGSSAFSPDGQVVAIGTFHGEGTRIFKRTGELIKNIGGRDGDVLFSPDGRWFATVTSDLCTIYDARTWEEKRHLPMNSATGLPGVAAFSPDSKILAFSVMRRTLKLVDPATGGELATLIPDPARQIDRIAFSPSGKRLMAVMRSGSVTTWDLAAMREKLTALKLDWTNEPQVAAPLSREQNVLKWVAVVSCLILVIVLGFSVVAWRRHRRFIGAYQDIEAMIEERNAQLAAAQSELFQSQKMQALGTLAAGIAHDFNNLLSVIRMSNQLTTEATQQNPEAQENGRIIDRAVAQGKSVVRAMLGYSRRSGTRDQFGVARVIEDTLALLRQQFLERVEVAVNLSGDVKKVFGNQNRFEQVLLNLIVNAVEAMKGEGRLRISTRIVNSPGLDLALKPAEADEYVEVTVADTGAGMPPEVLSRMFEPFFTTKTIGNEPGTGLGLSLVYGVCKEEGIGIGVKSVVGAGTEFHLFIPVENAKELHPNSDSATLAG